MMFSKQKAKEPSVAFEQVFAEEIEKAIEPSRQKRGVEKGRRPTKEDLIGLSFSGGGIRSATFNLGVIQAFAKERLLGLVDYLSTVSGGGYIGSWLSSWAYYHSQAAPKEPNHVAGVENELNRIPLNVEDKSEPDQIRFLRQYSNYLTPRLGSLSGDTLAFVGTYLRNLLLNQTILVTFAFALLGIPWFCGLLLTLGSGRSAALATMSMGAMLLAWVLWRISKNVNRSDADPPSTVIKWIVVPEFLCCGLLTLSVWYAQPLSLFPKSVPKVYVASLVVLVTAGLYTLLWCIGALLTPKPDVPTSEQEESSSPRLRWVPARWAFPAGLVAGASVLLGAKLVEGMNNWYVLTFGIPVGVLLVLIVGCIHLGLIGRSYGDGLREWWARLGGAVLAVLTYWLALCLIALFVPLGVKLLWHLLTSPAPEWVEKLWKGLGAVGITGAIGGWLTVTLRGLFIAKGPNSGAQANGAASAPQAQSELLARLAPPVFVLGVLVLLSYLLYASLDFVANGQGAKSAKEITCSPELYWNSLSSKSDLWTLALFIFGLFSASRFLGWRVDVNEFSLHNAYRNRLVRCYLGATHPDRKGQPFTGFDEKDNLHLHLLMGLGAPFQILNATLNALKGSDLALQARKARSFVFTPLYSGFEYHEKQDTGEGLKEVRGCYRLTEDCSKQSSQYRGARLGTAMAISGAAASPNMGFYTNPAVSFLLTVFSVRLGWWLGNPMEKDWWESGKPRSSWRALINELTGTTTEEAPEVYLSDGGHFDNLGVYELVRRRCRLIIACDAGADPTYSCIDLARVVEKCRVDFGAEIDIALDDLRPAAPLSPGDATARVSKNPFAMGTICYADGHTGKLIYIKPCLNTELPQDVLAYAGADPKFPHQSTADQFFDEAQFESYRALGYACASAAAATVTSAMRA